MLSFHGECTVNAMMFQSEEGQSIRGRALICAVGKHGLAYHDRDQGHDIRNRLYSAVSWKPEGWYDLGRAGSMCSVHSFFASQTYSEPTTLRMGALPSPTLAFALARTPYLKGNMTPSSTLTPCSPRPRCQPIRPHSLGAPPLRP